MKKHGVFYNAKTKKAILVATLTTKGGGTWDIGIFTKRMQEWDPDAALEWARRVRGFTLHSDTKQGWRWLVAELYGKVDVKYIDCAGQDELGFCCARDVVGNEYAPSAVIDPAFVVESGFQIRFACDASGKLACEVEYNAGTRNYPDYRQLRIVAESSPIVQLGFHPAPGRVHYGSITIIRVPEYVSWHPLQGWDELQWAEAEKEAA